MGSWPCAWSPSGLRRLWRQRRQRNGSHVACAVRRDPGLYGRSDTPKRIRVDGQLAVTATELRVTIMQFEEQDLGDRAVCLECERHRFDHQPPLGIRSDQRDLEATD